jgi:hypothetical protein
MAVDVRPEVLVHRPRAEVAAFMFDPANDLRWTGGITSSRPAQPGPLVEGATVERTASFLGRRFPMRVRYELQDAPEGTLVAIHAVGTPGRFFGWATPVMARQVRKSIAGDLGRLRAVLEG